MAVPTEQKIRAALTGSSTCAEIGDTIQGNQIRVRVVKPRPIQAKKVICFVHNPDPGAELVFLDSAEALLECVIAETDRRGAANRSRAS